MGRWGLYERLDARLRGHAARFGWEKIGMHDDERGLNLASTWTVMSSICIDFVFLKRLGLVQHDSELFLQGSCIPLTEVLLPGGLRSIPIIGT